MGTRLGTGVPEEIRQDIERFCTHWPPIIQAQHDGTLDLDTLSQDDREFLQNFNVPVIMAWGRVRLDWPTIEPNDLSCSTLWLIGSEDHLAVNSFREYEHSLPDSQVQCHIVAGATHSGVFDEIDQVFPILLAFMQS